MIAFHATPELKLTFEKMIRTMEVKVKWNGLFVIIDNTMILQGELRSLFFHLDNRKVLTNIIDLEVPVQQISRIENNEAVKNVINMLLYAFGKWGTIKGLKVEKDYNQLNLLFRNILGELEIEPEYTKEHFWFYENGIRVVYEDVMQYAIDSVKEESLATEEEESTGLWHKLVWNQKYEDFPIKETTLSERNKNRLGNNFYLTNYLCPSCEKKMHGVIYPIGKEFVIDTKEGRVQIARAYTCSACNRFYTPRPKRLLLDGDCYIMDFGGDKLAYQDYKELLGKNGAKVCNPNYNQYLDQMAPKNTHRNDAIAQKMAEREAVEELNELLEEIDDLPNREFHDFLAKVAEGFFPEKEIGPIEDALWKKYEARERGEKTTGGIRGHEKKLKEPLQREEKNGKTEQQKKAIEEKTERYKKRLELFPRLSDRQRMELMKQISLDNSIPEEIKNQLLEVGKTLKLKDNFKRLKEKIAEAKNKNRIVMLHVYEEIDHADLDESDRDKLFELTGVRLKEYNDYLAEKEEEASVRRKRVEDIIVQPKETVRRRRNEEFNDEREEEQTKYHVGRRKEPDKIVQIRRSDGSSYPNHKSVRQRMNFFNNKKNGNRKEEKIEVREKRSETEGGYRNRNAQAEPFARKKLNFSGADKAAQIREIESMIRQTKSSGREDLYQLWKDLLSRGFDEETLEPYAEHVKSQIQKIDEEYLDSLIGNLADMTSEEGVEAYEKIKEANLLPELKLNTMRQLEKRLAKVKAEECDLLVQKLQREMDEARVADSDRHHFYPAKKVFLKEATEDEVEVIHYARAAYGAGIGLFEYPIFAVDTSRDRSGEKGFFLTPEYLYYSTLTTSYCMSVFSIEKFGVLTGLLNRGFYVYQKNGEKTKLPHALELSELPKFAEVLTSYVKYLQEKPFSRKEAYLAKEQHDEICCFRCGYVYRGRSVCPKCGYKANR